MLESAHRLSAHVAGLSRDLVCNPAVLADALRADAEVPRLSRDGAFMDRVESGDPDAARRFRETSARAWPTFRRG